MALIFVIGVVLLTGYLDHKDKVAMARATWEQALVLDQPSVRAKTLLCRLERHERTILAEGIAAPDSFRAVQNRLNELRDEYWRLANEDQPAEPGSVTLGGR